LTLISNDYSGNSHATDWHIPEGALCDVSASLGLFRESTQVLGRWRASIMVSPDFDRERERLELARGQFGLTMNQMAQAKSLSPGHVAKMMGESG